MTLLERWRAGDLHAGHELVTRYFDRVSERFAPLGAGPRAVYVAETFARVARSLAQPDSDVELDALVSGHARAVLEGARRRSGGTPSGPLAETIDIDPSTRQT